MQYLIQPVGGICDLVVKWSGDHPQEQAKVKCSLFLRNNLHRNKPSYLSCASQHVIDSWNRQRLIVLWDTQPVIGEAHAVIEVC